MGSGNRLIRDPRLDCGGTDPFDPSLGYHSDRGYQYDIPQSESSRKTFSMWDFLGEVVMGGLTGGFTSAAFYGAGKGIERLKEGVRSNRNVRALKNNNLTRENVAQPIEMNLQFFGKKADIRQIEQIAKKFNMKPGQRRDFGDYIESLKKHKRNDANFSWQELMQIAEIFMKGE